MDSDPRVRLEMGDKIYEREAVVVEDPAEAQVALQALLILEVDVSNPGAVEFTSTAANAQNNVLNGDSTDGIVLLDFFSGNGGSLDSPLDIGAINVLDTVADNTRSPLNQIFVDDFDFFTFNDLNFYGTGGGGFDMFFFVTVPALTGSATHDLGGLTGFQTVGTIGDVYVGDPANNDIIGQWQIVPEPSTAALTALGLVGLAARRRRS